jgi:peptidoglycan/xylan/chitin deacetylase (PgdA/CDA1 family)
MTSASPPTSGRRVALMYHALTGPGSPPAGQDLHYSVPAARFDAHLRLLAAHGGACSARDWLGGGRPGATVLTFDDGHLSNYSLALPSLLEHGAGADFFVNPARVGTDGFADWAQLREMARLGMSIQSHGWDHRYFTALSPAELREDLRRSRTSIEDAIGQPVRLLAPPGGRMPAGLPALAAEAGYSHVLNSQPGFLSAGVSLLPRMAVTAQLDEDGLRGWLDGRGVARAQLRYAVLDLAKRALGDRAYERARARLLGPQRSGA